VPRPGLDKGEHAALTALEWDIAREDQDALAATSHHRLAAAYDAGFLDDMLTPYLGHERDENLRPDSSTEKLAKLKPVFGKGEAATMTAGNSTPLSDGASTVLLASEEWAAAHDLPVLAYLTHYETAAVDYVTGNEGLLMAPAYGGWTTLGTSSPSTSSHGKISHSWTGGIGRRPSTPTAATTRAWISSGDSGMATCCH
jgi:acetyl-CoA C-acetyltransferase